MIRKLVPMLVVVVIAMTSLGCGDDQVCQSFDVPVFGSECAEASACAEVDCEATCASDFSESTGAAFCDAQVCQCPCRVCADVPR